MHATESGAWDACHVFYDGKDLMETPALREAWLNLAAGRERKELCTSYPETPEFLALMMAMMGLDAIVKSTWSVVDEKEERAKILQAYESPENHDKNLCLAMEHNGVMTRLVWKQDEEKWILHYHAGTVIRKGKKSKELYVDKVPKANQSPTELTLLPDVFAKKHLLHRQLKEEHLIGNREEEWPVQSERRKAFLSGLLGKTEEEIPWETNTSSIVMAPISMAEEVFSKTEVAYGEERIPLGELMTVEFRHARGNRPPFDLFWEQVRWYPDKTSKKVATVLRPGDNRKFRVSAQPILQVVEDMETMQSVLQEDRDFVDIARMVSWDAQKSAQQASVLEHLIKEHLPFLLNCRGNFRQYTKMQDMLEEPVACLGLHQNYQGFGGAQEVACVRVPLAQYEVRDDARFLACMKKLQHLDQDQRNPFRILAFAMRKRLLHEVRFVERPDTKERGIPAEEYQHFLQRLQALIEETDDPDCNCVEREIYSLLQKFYLALCSEDGKHGKLKSLLRSPEACTQKVAILTPKASWSAVIREEYQDHRPQVVTARTYDPNTVYDLVIVTGRMAMHEEQGDAFARVPLGWNAKKTVLLLYPFEADGGARMLHDWENDRDAFLRAAGLSQAPEADDKAMEPATNEEATEDDWAEIERRLPSWREQLKNVWGAWGKHASDGTGFSKVSYLATLADGRHMLITGAEHGKKPFQQIVPRKDDAQKIDIQEINGGDVKPGMRFLYANDFGTREELLRSFLKNFGQQGWDPSDLACMKEWKQGLQSYRENYQLTYEDLRRELNAHGADISNVPTLRSWMAEDSTVLGPEQQKKEQVFRAIGAVLPAPFAKHTWQEYMGATDRVRDVRRALQQLVTEEIPMAYLAEKNGDPSKSSRQQALREHLDEICDVYEVDDVQPLHLCISQNYVNKPLEDVPIQEKENSNE